MDLAIEKLHRTLLDAALPSTVEDLKNATEDYVVNLLTTFLSRFEINMSLIDQPIPEQLIAMPYYEDSDVINLINLHTVVTRIFDKIFLHDFCLSDITSPGQKRFRKQVKFLSNFVLYTIHKKSGFNDKMDQIQTMSKLLEDAKERKAQVAESINNKLMHKAKQLSIIEKLENEIQCIQSKADKINKKEAELERIKSEVEQKNQKAKERCGSVRTKAGKLSKLINEVRSQVVQSPKKYQSRLDEIEKQHKSKVEERDIMQEAIQEKKQSIKQIEEKLNLVQRITDDFRVLADIYKEQKDKKTKLNNVTKATDSLNNNLKESKTKLAIHNDQMDSEKKKLQIYIEEDMMPLHTLHIQVLSEKKILKTKLDKDRDCFNEKCLRRNKLQTEIKKIEEETTDLIKNAQECYDNDIANEIELQKAWREE
ncbi:PREDICTED: probable kinetochore protein nuf2 [Wasmannia auropunctata]|uniref:probable kinetochore protein nuf2 n=1 Tax=Wasmannia auropunctata TaxID=64793 RepID=UPI0005ED63F4|nr:PREDICTED: probable kinetochore protein nuf2 [Wasmannia auropunctata]